MRVLWRSSLGREEATPEVLPAGVELKKAADLDAALALRDWTQVLIDGRPPAELLDGAALERVVVPFAGVPASLREALAERPHLKAHNSHFNAALVAQQALALLLACANRVVPADGALRRGDWRSRERDGRPSLDLRGRRCLLAGYGAIGRALEPALRALGMIPMALRRHPDPQAPLPTFDREALPAALAEAEVVVVSLPGTPDTKALLGERELRTLPRGALLVNVGRGEVIDEWALYRALCDGHLSGAGLDVWWRYPEDETARAATLPAAAPLHLLDTVVLSPHRAAEVAGWQRLAVEDVALTLAAAQRGEERNRVDPRRGY